MTLVVSCLGIAVGGTCGRIIPLSLTEWMILVAHVGVLTLGVVGSIDGSTKLSGASIARNRRWRGCFVVGVGASDDNAKAIPPLSCIGSFSSRDRCTPERTFEVGDARWVWAAVHVRIQTWVAFDVHVERLASGSLIAKRGASESIEALQCLEAHVIRGAQRCPAVLHYHRIAVRGCGIFSQRCIDRVG